MKLSKLWSAAVIPGVLAALAVTLAAVLLIRPDGPTVLQDKASRGGAPTAPPSPTPAPKPTAPGGPLYVRGSAVRLRPLPAPPKLGETEAVQIARQHAADPEHPAPIASGPWLATLVRFGERRERTLPVWAVSFGNTPAWDANWMGRKPNPDMVGRQVLLINAASGALEQEVVQPPGPLTTPEPPCRTCGATPAWAADSPPSPCADPNRRPPRLAGSLTEDGVEPTIENWASGIPYAVVATVEGRKRSRWNTPDDCPPPNANGPGVPVVTPIKLRVEREVVREVSVPARAEYVVWGGTIGRYGYTATGPGTLLPGRYLLYLRPSKDAAGNPTPAQFRINQAFPIDEQERVRDLGGELRPLVPTLRRIQDLASDRAQLPRQDYVWDPETPFESWFFVQFDGIAYTILGGGRAGPGKHSFGPEDLGPVYARTKVNLNTADVDRETYVSRDGDAACGDAGNPVYTVRGYDPSFRLAAYCFEGDKEPALFEADVNPRARKGADLLPLEGKVEHVTISGGDAPNRKLGEIREPARVRELVAMLLSAPTRPAVKDFDWPYYTLTFHTADGLDVSRIYWRDTRQLTPHNAVASTAIALPPAFGRVVEQAVERGR